MYNRLRAAIHLDYEPIFNEEKSILNSANWYEKWYGEYIGRSDGGGSGGGGDAAAAADGNNRERLAKKKIEKSQTIKW